jgi:hypothetical protein
MPITRRRLLQLSALSLWGWQAARASGGARELIAVSCAGNGTPLLALIDPVVPKLLGALTFPAAFAFPAQRWHADRNVIYGSAGGAVLACSLRSGQVLFRVKTGSSQNYLELSPDGTRLAVAVFSGSRYLLLDTDRTSPHYGQVMAERRAQSGSHPCDMTIAADGQVAFSPERGSGRVVALRLPDLRELGALQLNRAWMPYMGAVSPQGGVMFTELAAGGEAVLDVRDPAKPKLLRHITPKDGLGRGPIKDAFSPNGRWNLIVCRDSSSLSVVDTHSLEVTQNLQLPSGSLPLGSHLRRLRATGLRAPARPRRGGGDRRAGRPLRGGDAAGRTPAAAGGDQSGRPAARAAEQRPAAGAGPGLGPGVPGLPAALLRATLSSGWLGGGSALLGFRHLLGGQDGDHRDVWVDP